MIIAQKSKARICWITADCFVDWDIDIIKSLSERYYIDWKVVFPKTLSRNTGEYIESKLKYTNVKMNAYYCKYRLRDVRNVWFYYSLFREILKNKYNVVYVNLPGFPYLAIVAYFMMNKIKTIIAVHQAIVHGGMRHKLLTSLYFKLLYTTFNNFHLFSETQSDLFKRLYAGKNVFIIPLMLMDYGQSDIKPPKHEIIFLSFGNIIKSKNIDCLIQATCNLYEMGYRNIKVKIVGFCENWGEYEKMIKYPEMFVTIIKQIEQDEIPDLFCSSHYVILPYSAVSQSGVLKVAFRYNIPVIASDLDEFKMDIIDNQTGYLFKKSNVADLQIVLIKAISNHDKKYEEMLKCQSEHINSRYSVTVLKREYEKMLESIQCQKSKNI